MEIKINTCILTNFDLNISYMYWFLCFYFIYFFLTKQGQIPIRILEKDKRTFAKNTKNPIVFGRKRKILNSILKNKVISVMTYMRVITQKI
jgi:hypothetical protein